MELAAAVLHGRDVEPDETHQALQGRSVNSGGQGPGGLKESAPAGACGTTVIGSLWLSGSTPATTLSTTARRWFSSCAGPGQEARRGGGTRSTKSFSRNAQRSLSRKLPSSLSLLTLTASSFRPLAVRELGNGSPPATCRRCWSFGSKDIALKFKEAFEEAKVLNNETRRSGDFEAVFHVTSCFLLARHFCPLLRDVEWLMDSSILICLLPPSSTRTSWRSPLPVKLEQARLSCEQWSRRG